MVSLSTVPAAPPFVATPPGNAVAPAVAAAPAAATVRPGAVPVPQSAAALPSFTAAAPAAATGEPVVGSLGAGVGVLALLVLLLQPFLGDRIARALSGIYTSGEATTCPWEEP
jgi:hypothetical protein